MSNVAPVPDNARLDEKDALGTPFVKCLLRLMRAEDTFELWQEKSDADLVGDFIVTRQQRRAIPLIGGPDLEVQWRLEIFYAAVALAIEEQSGLIASPVLTVNHEGFGRILLTAGRLVVLSKTLRDVHRFGFDNLRKLAEAGTGLVDNGLTTIKTYSDVARV